MRSRAPDGVLITALHLLSLALDISQEQVQRGNVDNSLLASAGGGLNDGDDDRSLLSLLVSLMRRENVCSFVESDGFDLSSLLKILLQKFTGLGSGCLDKLQILAPEVVKPSSDADNSASMSDIDERKAKGREKQAALLENLKAENLKLMENIYLTGEIGLNDSNDAEESISDVANDSDGHKQGICSFCHDANSMSPVFFLVHLQKSRVVSLLDNGPPSWEKEVKRSETQQVSYTDEELHTQTSSSSETMISTSSSADAFEETMHTQILAVMENDMIKAEGFSAAECSSNEHSLLGKYIASSFISLAGGSRSKAQPISATYGGFRPSDCNGIYVSTCEHVALQKCLDAYLLFLRELSHKTIHYGARQILNPEREFLCPTCRALANSVLPDLPREGTKDIGQFLCSPDANDAFLIKALSLLQAAGDVSGRNEFLDSFPV